MKKEDRIQKLQRLTDELDEFMEQEFPEYIDDVRAQEAKEFEKDAKRYHRKDVRGVATGRSATRPSTNSGARTRAKDSDARRK